jgi:HPt (histidine-containing phosphotransfer) domain-containing protein
MDGYELTRSVREMEQQIGAKHIPIIAWSANVLSEEADHCRTAGMDDLLNDLADLRAMLVKWLPMTNGPSTGTYPVYVLQVKHDTPLDLRVLNKFGSDRAALIELLEVFKEQNRADIVLLHNILQREDQLAVARAAHRIKGACQMMGARELEALSIRIEQAAKQGDLQDARTAAEMLDEVVVRLEMEIAGFIKR